MAALPSSVLPGAPQPADPWGAITPLPAANDTPPAPPPINPADLERVGGMLKQRFTGYESDRKLAELRWTKNYRQYLGIYDPDIEKQLSPNRSKAYPKLTRTKCVSMLSRLMNLLFPSDDKNWTVSASAVPNLPQDQLQAVLNKLVPPQPAGAGLVMPGQPAPPPPPMPTDAQIEQAIRKAAQEPADAIGLIVEDQLQELGGARMMSYVALVRQVLDSGIKYGAGILKGPFVVKQTLRKWAQDANGNLQAEPYTAYRPRFEWVPVWDYYPDMAAKTINQMDGQFERKVMSKHELLKLKKREDFFADQIAKFIRERPDGNYERRAFETEMRADGPQSNVSTATKGKYEIIIWTGYMAGSDLQSVGVTLTDEQAEGDVKGEVWMLDGTVIKADMDPWVTMEEEDMPLYHHFIFEEDETFLLGNSLPNIMRDSQMGLCAAVRMIMDNGSVQRNLEVNTNMLRLDNDVTAITNDKIWYRDPEESDATAQYPAVRVIDFPMHIPEMQSIVTMFEGFADTETFVNAATGGDMQKGPSEPFRTAAGASMLRGDAALPFKDVVRNFDKFTESVIGAMLIFNEHYNPDGPQGDYMPVARGATSLIAKEVLGIQLDSLVQTLMPEEKQYIKIRNLLRARVRTRDLVVADVVMDDSECDAVDQAAQAAQQAQQAEAQKMSDATVREILATALNKIAQAGKNSAAAEATSINTTLETLEKGLNPAALGVGGNGTGQQGVSGATPNAGAAGAGDPGPSLGASLQGTPADLATAAAGGTLPAAAMPTQ